MVGIGSNWNALLPGAVGERLCMTSTGVGWCEAMGAAGTTVWQPATVMLHAGNFATSVTGWTAGADKEFGGDTRFRPKQDTQGFTQIALTYSVQTPSLSPMTIRIQYWNGSAWVTISGLTSTLTTPDILVEVAFTTLPAAARAQGTIFRALLGPAPETPIAVTFNMVQLHFRP
jgi:hypothetical protein